MSESDDVVRGERSLLAGGTWISLREEVVDADDASATRQHSDANFNVNEALIRFAKASKRVKD